MSKLSFQYGFSVFLMTDVVLVCSPPMVATAKGSGNPSITGYQSSITDESGLGVLTEEITLVQSICRND